MLNNGFGYTLDDNETCKVHTQHWLALATLAASTAMAAAAATTETDSTGADATTRRRTHVTEDERMTATSPTITALLTPERFAQGL